MSKTETKVSVGILLVVFLMAIVFMLAFPRVYNPLEYRSEPLKGANEITLSKGGSKLVLDRNNNDLYLFVGDKLVATGNTGGVTNDVYQRILKLAGWDTESLIMIKAPDGMQWSYLGLAQEMVKELDIECEYTKGGFTHKLPVHGFQEVKDETLEINAEEVLQL